ncbi:restriction endonuclease subunit S [Escherichia coli]|uniref:restriction endonuclease subunit S n=1 Tax=Klebsiella quasipneumoniae TaxID=1463165 RepID=UPI002652312F|nr:restriction endonuclease subunit S [Klebsiella quasipneumoniae]MDN7346926.1 restriction endonuclease subunit S [Klebsiella quasipneumoniae]CAI6331244.1 restriction endonuclease subunit S [Escherichia coli]HCB1085583.1 restriction endonuclease subunit S [Klebsiella variicola subsp. variicola]HCT2636783.1 restriction endonuclease subunit S [Enterobacter roggenkampii]
MSEMSYLEKLLDGVEVEWKSLGEVAEIYGGLTGKTKADFEKGNARYISYKKIFGSLDIKNMPTDYVHVREDERQHEVRYGDILFTGSSEIAEEAGISCAVTSQFDEPVYLNSFSFGVRFNNKIKLTPEFLKYLFRTNKMRKEISKTASGVTRFNISKARFKKILIPILCPNNPEKSLAIQSEIVRILDKFTELTAELTAELTMRKKQYNYYRDRLLSFEGKEVEWRALGEVLNMRAGQHISASKIMSSPNDECSYPCFGGNGVRGFVKDKSHNGEHLLIGRQGALCGNVQRMKGMFYATEHAVVVTAGNEIDVDWAFHMLSAMNLNQYASQSAQPGLAVGKIQTLKIPLPCIEIQKKTAKILDKFDTLTNSITEGLPREIELRQKQYEYYRDLLFSFPKPDSVTN